MNKTFKYKIFLLLLFLSFMIFYLIIINQNTGIIKIDNKLPKGVSKNNTSTTFLNVEYKFYDQKGRAYTLNGKEAKINKKIPNLINLKTVKAKTNLSDNSLLEIYSDAASFLKNKKDIFFYKNILLKNKNIMITSDNANFFHKTNIIEIFGNVTLKDSKSIIKCDRIIYNTLTKNIELKMDSKNKQIYGNRKI